MQRAFGRWPLVEVHAAAAAGTTGQTDGAASAATHSSLVTLGVCESKGVLCAEAYSAPERALLARFGVVFLAPRPSPRVKDTVQAGRLPCVAALQAVARGRSACHDAEACRALRSYAVGALGSRPGVARGLASLLQQLPVFETVGGKFVASTANAAAREGALPMLPPAGGGSVWGALLGKVAAFAPCLAPGGGSGGADHVAALLEMAAVEHAWDTGIFGGERVVLQHSCTSTRAHKQSPEPVNRTHLVAKHRVL